MTPKKVIPHLKDNTIIAYFLVKYNLFLKNNQFFLSYFVDVKKCKVSVNSLHLLYSCFTVSSVNQFTVSKSVKCFTFSLHLESVKFTMEKSVKFCQVKCKIM